MSVNCRFAQTPDTVLSFRGFAYTVLQSLLLFHGQNTRKHHEDHLYIVNRGRFWIASSDRDASVLPASLWLGLPDSVLLYRLSLLHPSVVD